MKERPILFSGDMVRAILDGRKTQTRRPIKPTRRDADGVGSYYSDGSARELVNTFENEPIDAPPIQSPWKVGDRLWVKETWQALRFSKDFETGYVDDIYFAEIIPKHNDDAPYANPWEVAYAADPCWESHREDRGFPWRPSIHMPRWASRITLEVTSVRAERVQDITNDDALREGIHPLSYEAYESPRMGFRELWERTYPGSWDRNDGVWVLDFRRQES